jgi:type I restriction enzyme M protein
MDETMARVKKSQTRKTGNGANLGFEEKLWQAADKMRGYMVATGARME